MSTEHSKRAAKFTADVEKTTWHDATFWSVRQKRDKMAHELPEWEDLRELASEIKMHTITHLADYLDVFPRIWRVVVSRCIGQRMRRNLMRLCSAF